MRRTLSVVAAGLLVAAVALASPAGAADKKPADKAGSMPHHGNGNFHHDRSDDNRRSSDHDSDHHFGFHRHGYGYPFFYGYPAGYCPSYDSYYYGASYYRTPYSDCLSYAPSYRYPYYGGYPNGDDPAMSSGYARSAPGMPASPMPD